MVEEVEAQLLLRGLPRCRFVVLSFRGGGRRRSGSGSSGSSRRGIGFRRGRERVCSGGGVRGTGLLLLLLLRFVPLRGCGGLGLLRPCCLLCCLLLLLLLLRLLLIGLLLIATEIFINRNPKAKAILQKYLE